MLIYLCQREPVMYVNCDINSAVACYVILHIHHKYELVSVV